VLQQGSELAIANGGTAAWLNGGHLRPRDGTGVAHEHRETEANEIRAKRREKVERRGGVHGAELPGELGHALASDSHGRVPYHGKPR
jgi:hypothetical protein